MSLEECKERTLSSSSTTKWVECRESRVRAFSGVHRKRVRYNGHKLQDEIQRKKLTGQGCEQSDVTLELALL